MLHFYTPCHFCFMSSDSFDTHYSNHCVKSVQIRNTGKYGPEKTPYLDIFHEVNIPTVNFEHRIEYAER